MSKHTRDFNVMEVGNGYEIRISQQNPPNDIYLEPTRGVATEKSEVKEIFSKWVDGDDDPFTTIKNEKEKA